MLIDPADERHLWLVLRTKPKLERAVLEALGGRDVEGYCPRVLAPRENKRAPLGPTPLFPSYVFARCVPAQRLSAVNYCPGAVGVLRFGGYLAAVGDDVVAMLREREGDRGHIVVGEARRRPAPGERMRVVKGPLAGFEGVVERYLPARDRVRLLLALVGSVRSVEVEAGHLERPKRG